MAVVALSHSGRPQVAAALELTSFFFRHFFNRYRLMAPNVHMTQGYEIDVLAVRQSGFVDEVEIKTCRSDFLADFKKMVSVEDGFVEHPWGGRARQWKRLNKHHALSSGLLTANYFSFLMPESLADSCAAGIPEYAGIYTAKPGEAWSLREKRKPKLLHRKKISDSLEMKILRKIAWRYTDSVREVTRTER